LADTPLGIGSGCRAYYLNGSDGSEWRLIVEVVNIIGYSGMGMMFLGTPVFATLAWWANKKKWDDSFFWFPFMVGWVLVVLAIGGVGR